MDLNTIEEAVNLSDSVKQNFIFWSVIILLIGGIGTLITRLIQFLRHLGRKEEELNKLALELTKLKEKSWQGGTAEFPALTHFFTIKRSLREKIRTGEDYRKWLEREEERLSQKIDDLENSLQRLEEEEEKKTNKDGKHKKEVQ